MIELRRIIELYPINSDEEIEADDTEEDNELEQVSQVLGQV